jgi:hypothetical protein
MVVPCTRCTLVDRDDPIAEMVAKKIIEVGATVRDPEEVCKLAVEQLGRPNKTGLTFRFLCLALADPSPIRLAAVRRCGSVDAGQQVGVFRYISAVAKTDHRVLLD